MAGMESSAKRRSVVPSATTTANIGVKSSTPPRRSHTLPLPQSPSSVCGSTVRAHPTSRFSVYSSSSSGPSMASLKPV